MQAKLLPLTYKADNLIDYTRGIITRNYEYEGAQYYFSLFPEISPMAGHALSGRYLAVLASIKGLEHFYIESDGEGNYSVDEIETETVQDECTNTIEHAAVMEIVKDDPEPVESSAVNEEISTTPVIKMPLPSPGIDMAIDQPNEDKPVSEYDGEYDDAYPHLEYKAFHQDSGILTLMSIAIAQWKENN